MSQIWGVFYLAMRMRSLELGLAEPQQYARDFMHVGHRSEAQPKFSQTYIEYPPT